MDRIARIALLRRKMELVAENTHAEANPAFVRRLFGKFLERAERYPRMPERAFKEMDLELEQMMSCYVPRGDHGKLRDALIKEFGCSRLTASSKAIMNRVLKRGSIQTEEEYYEIQEIVTNVDNMDRLGQATYARLDMLAGGFRPPEERAPPRPKASTHAIPAEDEIPRWPMVPPDGDDHLCPPGTSLETMEKFLRVKAARLQEHYGDAEDSRTFAQTLEWGLQGVHGPTTAPERRDFAMRYLDHELEFFSGDVVTMEQLDAVEQALRTEFGFSRLLPSPRRLGLLALNVGSVDEPFIKLIIERALHNYTAPPLFSAAEARELRKALKPKPASAP